jgi:hypothetical protein
MVTANPLIFGWLSIRPGNWLIDSMGYNSKRQSVIAYLQNLSVKYCFEKD